jgi:hypothetical protein
MGLTPTVEESLTQTITQDTSYSSGAPVWMSLHSANPGSSGSNEVTTGSGSFARQEVAFTGSSGTDTNVAEVTFTISGATVTWIGYWTAETSGTFLGGFALVGAGTVLTGISASATLTSPGHGLAVNDTVRLFELIGDVASSVPAGFSADTVYYVVAESMNTLELSASMGGSAITPSSSASCGMFVDAGEYGATGLIHFPATTGVTYVTTS